MILVSGAGRVMGCARLRRAEAAARMAAARARAEAAMVSAVRAPRSPGRETEMYWTRWKKGDEVEATAIGEEGVEDDDVGEPGEHGTGFGEGGGGFTWVAGVAEETDEGIARWGMVLDDEDAEVVLRSVGSLGWFGAVGHVFG